MELRQTCSCLSMSEGKMSPGQSQSRTVGVRKMVWKCFVWPGVRDVLTSWREGGSNYDLELKERLFTKNLLSHESIEQGGLANIGMACSRRNNQCPLDFHIRNVYLPTIPMVNTPSLTSSLSRGELVAAERKTTD